LAYFVFRLHCQSEVKSITKQGSTQGAILNVGQTFRQRLDLIRVGSKSERLGWSGFGVLSKPVLEFERPVFSVTSKMAQIFGYVRRGILNKKNIITFLCHPHQPPISDKKYRFSAF